MGFGRGRVKRAAGLEKLKTHTLVLVGKVVRSEQTQVL